MEDYRTGMIVAMINNLFDKKPKDPFYFFPHHKRKETQERKTLKGEEELRLRLMNAKFVKLANRRAKDAKQEEGR